MSIITQAESYVFPLLEEHCGKYPYHNPDHTRTVRKRALFLAEQAGIGDEEKEDLELATLFHDIGFIKQYDKNEHLGAKIAREWLTSKNHPEARIQRIEKIIMATVLFSEPHTILEEIIQDSDLENLGQTVEFRFSTNYLHELRTIAKNEISDAKFWSFVKKLLSKYHFHTAKAQEENKAQKEKNLALVNAYFNAMGYTEE